MKLNHKKIYVFLVLIAMVTCKKKPEKIILGIQSFGTFPSYIQDSIKNALENEFGFKVIINPTKKMPTEFFVHEKTPRYRADKIIKHLRDGFDSLDYVLGVTSYDISTTKKDKLGNVKEPKEKYNDWGVFGLGYLDAKGAIVSDFRTKNTTKEKYISRMQKISIHEIGHNLGLPHCENESCVMTDAVETIRTVDNANKTLCAKCRLKI